MPLMERQEESIAKTRAKNQELYPNQVLYVNDAKIPKTPIYIFNVAPLYHDVSRPPLFPHAHFAACPPNKPYILVGSHAHPTSMETLDQDGYKIIDNNVDGYQEVTRMLSPMNPGLDQNFDQEFFSYGNNLNNYGLFWSTNFIPTEEELEAAHARVRKTFLKELEVMAKVESEEGTVGALARANRFSHAAAEMFPEDRTWHRMGLKEKNELQKVNCPVCDEQISKKAAKCRFCGAIFDKEVALAYKATPREPGRPKPSNGSDADQDV